MRRCFGLYSHLRKFLSLVGLFTEGWLHLQTLTFNSRFPPRDAIVKASSGRGGHGFSPSKYRRADTMILSRRYSMYECVEVISSEILELEVSMPFSEVLGSHPSYTIF